jgi:hypothetical protein
MRALAQNFSRVFPMANTTRAPHLLSTPSNFPSNSINQFWFLTDRAW